MAGDQKSIRVHVPDELKNGVYANVAAVWHTPYDFTLDFMCLGREEAEVVARVKVPTQVIFQIASAIAANVDKFEQQFGSITPAPPTEPPTVGDDPQPS